MQNKFRNRKKGFTIVELVIVIAVIAILAAVLIPTFVSIVKKANLSNDQQNVRNMNTVLAVEAIPDTTFESAGDAVNALYRNGWNDGKLQTYSNGYHYAYSLERNKFYLLNESGAKVYPEESVNESSLWCFYNNTNVAKVQGVVNYVATTNVTNATALHEAFQGEEKYTIDLNGYYVGIDSEEGFYNITVKNGSFVRGNLTKDESTIVEFTKVEQKNIEKGTADKPVIYENCLFDDLQGTSDGKAIAFGVTFVSFKNCAFYNSAIRLDDGDITIENCTFNGGVSGSGVIELYQNGIYGGTEDKDVTVTIKNCAFNNVSRGISISHDPAHDPNGSPKFHYNKTVTIEGCEFNGAQDEKYLIQIADPHAKLTVKDCKFNALGKAATVFRFHDSLWTAKCCKYSSEMLKNINLINNTFAQSIIDKNTCVDADDNPDETRKQFLVEARKVIK